VKIRDLLQGELPPAKYRDREPEFLFSAEDVLEEIVVTEYALPPLLPSVHGGDWRSEHPPERRLSHRGVVGWREFWI
jgi:hypothetical protein